jgi:hypothetical protein
MPSHTVRRYLVRFRRVWRDLFFRGAALLALALAAFIFSLMGYDAPYTQINKTKDYAEYYGNEAERKVASYTLLLDILTAGLAVSTFGLWLVAICGIINQKRETARALWLTRELFITEKRPWIKVDVVSTSPTARSIYRDDGWISIRLKLSLHNVGESPAFKVTRGWVFMFPTQGGGHATFQGFLDSIRGEVDARMDYMGRVMFPNDIVKIDVDLNISPWQIEQTKTSEFRGKFVPICVKYYSDLTGKVHETTCVFALGVTDPLLSLDIETQRNLSRRIFFDRVSGFDRIT